jgi:hypothetical protein
MMANAKIVLEMSIAESAALYSAALNFCDYIETTPDFEKYQDDIVDLCEYMKYLPLRPEFSIKQAKALSAAICTQWEMFNMLGERFKQSADMLMSIHKLLQKYQ